MSDFRFELNNREYYIECSLSGNLGKDDLAGAAGAILDLSSKSGIKRILFDASSLKSATFHAVIGPAFHYFKDLSSRMEAMATYGSDKKLYAFSKFFEVVLRIKHHRSYKTKEKAIWFLNNFQSAKLPPLHEAFRYHLSVQENYILCRVSGVPNKEGIVLVADEIIALVKKSGINKLLLDANGVKPFYSTLGQGIKYFKIITENIERGASFIPDRKIYTLGRFIELVSGVKNWKTFNKKTEAIIWLMKNSADSYARR